MWANVQQILFLQSAALEFSQSKFDCKVKYTTINSEIFARILFWRIALKDIFVTVKKSRLMHDLPTLVNDRVTSPFHEGIIFTKLCIKFPNLQYFAT